MYAKCTGYVGIKYKEESPVNILYKEKKEKIIRTA
jgi:hypothetical protein